MLRIKRLYTFIYQSFFPLFIMTFGICLFVFIIQLLWQHVDKLVGKGLDTSVIVEFFVYGALSLIPRVLPLAVLLASLMTFGNLGERLELLAIKASGISLMKIMKPMIILVVLITIGSFVFQNRLAPTLSVKLYTLMYSIKKKNPTVDIPEGSFYSMPGLNYSMYVKHKNLETGMLKNVIIYDMSEGSGVSSIKVNVCDSALMVGGEDRDYITLKMFHGESFKYLNKDGARRSYYKANENISYFREIFDYQEVVIPFSSELERLDESAYDDSHVSKNLDALELSIDSMTRLVDSLNIVDKKNISLQVSASHRKVQSYTDSVAHAAENKETKVAVNQAKIKLVNIDSVFSSYSLQAQKRIFEKAFNDADRAKSNSNLLFHNFEMAKPTLQQSVRMHKIYWHRMFSIPFACIIFFFIGAPLGAIIRKGGLGVPVIISVVLYIVYYVIGNVGYKMARDGIWPAWQGEWLSAAVLFPLGVFLTYKSMRESALFNVELYGQFARKIFRIKDTEEYLKNARIIRIDIPKAEKVTTDTELLENYRGLNIEELKDIALNYRAYGHDENMRLLALSILVEKNEDIDQFMQKDDYKLRKELANSFDKTSYITIGAYLAGLACYIFSLPGAEIVYAIYAIVYFRSALLYSTYMSLTESVLKNTRFHIKKTLTILLSLVAYPIMYIFMHNGMQKDLSKKKNSSFK